MVKQQQLRSNVDGQAPLPADLADGELALNFNANSPAVYLKDSAGVVRQVAGPGSQSLDDLTDCDTTTTAPVIGDSLIYDGTNYTPGIAAASPVGGISLGYSFSTDIAMVDPGSGDWRGDNADLTLVTQLAVSDTTRFGNNASVVWGNVNIGDYLGIWEETGSRDSVYYQVTAIVDNGLWHLVDVVYIPGATASLGNNAATEIFIIDNPANQLPPGGAIDEVLVKSSGTDYDTAWSSSINGGTY